MLDRILAEAGVPDGVVNMVIGYGHTAGAAITAHPDVEKVAFTGSTEVGRAIVQAAAESNLKKITLELGGKSPVVIFDDANLDLAIAMAAFGTFIHSGQACVCGSRIFAQRGVYEQVVQASPTMGEQPQAGRPQGRGRMIGPLISQKQLTRVMGYIEQGKSNGVEVVTGGHRLDRKGYFVHPTVLTNVDRHQQALPGGDLRARGDDPAVRRRGRSDRHGQRQHLRLAATVWTTDLGRAHRVAKRLKAGTVGLNCQMKFDHSMPFGGYKQSGWGYESGKAGIDDLPADEDRMGADVGAPRA